MLAILGLLLIVQEDAPLPAALVSYVEGDLEVSRYEAVEVDLNGDGVREAIVYARDRAFCGSGGCTLFVLSPEGASYRTVAHTTVTRLPIRMLEETSHGWHDLAVTVAGGGIRNAYFARLRFDGTTYPGNPTVAPAVRASDTAGVDLLAD